MHMVYIIIIMVFAGILGGLVNNFMYAKLDVEKQYKRYNLIKSIIIGMAASFLVPLFLNMISSDLIKSSEEDYYKLFIFLGFCTIAAIASSTFINSMTSSFLKQVDEVKNQMNYINRYINPIVNKVVEDDVNETREDTISNKNDSEQIINSDKIIDDEKITILNAICYSRFVFRSIDGISKETNLEIIKVKAILSELIVKGYIDSFVKNKHIRYFVTNDGNEVIKYYNAKKQIV
ncbi:YEATS-associated helix-containing protein [Abyssisolibacter fermentans]|uniref:YEATS-associated helix-containing protein n=1 Tax=Abyssisolibacter fermentans TaxID=1766203 RepID=UPI00082FCDA8|nr:YEATS-associated helix-containing protein [Abyssisolibacter fermentans]